MGFEGNLCVQCNQSIRYVHSCLELTMLIKMSTSNPIWKLVVLEYSAWATCLAARLDLQKVQDPLTQGANLLTVIVVRERSALFKQNVEGWVVNYKKEIYIILFKQC